MAAAAAAATGPNVCDKFRDIKLQVRMWPGAAQCTLAHAMHVCSPFVQCTFTCCCCQFVASSSVGAAPHIMHPRLTMLTHSSPVHELAHPHSYISFVMSIRRQQTSQVSTSVCCSTTQTKPGRRCMMLSVMMVAATSQGRRRATVNAGHWSFMHGCWTGNGLLLGFGMRTEDDITNAVDGQRSSRAALC